MPPYHVSTAQFTAGQLLQPGSWGRATRQFRRNGRALTDVGDGKILAWESCLETARRLIVPNAPSRLDCVFTCETPVGAAAFRARFRHTATVYEVEPDTAGAPTFTADYDLITDVGDEPFVDDWVRPRDSVLDFEPARNCRGAETPLPTPGVAMPKIAKPKAGPENIASKLSARERLILFCAAAGIDHAAVGITARAMQAIAIRGLITRDRELGGTYVLTETGRAAVAATLERAGIKIAARRPTAPG